MSGSRCTKGLAPPSPYWGIGHCRAKAKRDPSCTRWVKRRPRAWSGNRRLAERNAAPGHGAKKPARTWAMSGSPQPVRCRAAGEGCPQEMQPLLQGSQSAAAPSQKLARRPAQRRAPASRTGKQGLSADATSATRSSVATREASQSLQHRHRSLHVAASRVIRVCQKAGMQGAYVRLPACRAVQSPAQSVPGIQ